MPRASLATTIRAPARTAALLAPWIAGLLLSGCAGPPAGILAGAGSPAPSRAPGHCPPGDPLARVYHPDRLRVLARCREAKGTVAIERDEADGDHHLWIHLDPAFVSLARGKDFYKGSPELVLEIVPDCARRPSDADQASRCPASELPVPGPGDRVDAWGAYVFDTEHGWAEIHPVTAISIA